jgi:hypothetical protein
MRTWTRHIAPALLAVFGGLGPGFVHAQQQEPADLRDDIVVKEPPRLARSDTPNVAMPSLPGYRTDMTELSYRRWASAGRASVGIGVGTITLTDRAMGGGVGGVGGGVPLRDAAPVAVASGSVLMLGLHYRATETSSVYADASRVSGLGLNGDDQVVGKVGMEFKAARSQWNVAYGGLGFRMAGDARMTVKLRRGGIGLFMRSAF